MFGTFLGISDSRERWLTVDCHSRVQCFGLVAGKVSRKESQQSNRLSPTCCMFLNSNRQILHTMPLKTTWNLDFFFSLLGRNSKKLWTQYRHVITFWSWFGNRVSKQMPMYTSGLYGISFIWSLLNISPIFALINGPAVATVPFSWWDLQCGAIITVLCINVVICRPTHRNDWAPDASNVYFIHINYGYTIYNRNYRPQ